MIIPFPPIRLAAMTRLRKRNRLQPKATVADVHMGRPVDLVVLATKTTGAICRLQGREEVLTLRTSPGPDLIPGRTLTLQPDRVWAYQGNTYVSGERTGNRLEITSLGLAPLALKEWGPWDPEEEDWAEDGRPAPPWVRPIIRRGPRPSFELEACRPGNDPETGGWDSDPVMEAIELWESGKKVQAMRLLEEACRADLRCLDAHAHLGAFHFDRQPAKALLHYHVGVAIGWLSLGPDFDGVLPWGCLDNRPYLRCLHGSGLCYWRLGFFTEAKRVFERMLWMNPSDNQGVRFVLPAVRAKRDWQAFTDEEEVRRGRSR